MHIGNVALGKFKARKMVPKDFVAPGLNQLIRSIYVINRASISMVDDRPATTGGINIRRPPLYRLQQDARRHKGQRPAAGPGQRMGSQAFYDRAHVILAAVPCDFRHNHVALSNIAPDNLVNLIHKSPSNHIRMSPT